jgi:preprotein translocase subunit SecD
VDDQIVITDEVMRGKSADESWVERMKRAFFIIFAAYFTMIVAMLPLWFIGAGVLKGFALTTIVGVTIGVFITRPAFAKIIEQLNE